MWLEIDRLNKGEIMNKKWKVMIFSLAIILVILVGSCLLVYNGILQLNNPSEKDYPIKGIDVSWYQGDIDWEILSKEGIEFAFIKATEGSGSIDKKFDDNFENAINTDLKVGAYHFFSYDSEGKTQADNFIQTVDKVEGMLPPVVDIEFYGDKEENLPNKEDTTKELTILLDQLENHYGKKPIIYATEKSYDLYIADEFQEYDIWIRGVYQKPTLSDNREWTFWQYTNREVLEGYEGTETYIDMNVFNGTSQQWKQYIK